VCVCVCVCVCERTDKHAIRKLSTGQKAKHWKLGQTMSTWLGVFWVGLLTDDLVQSAAFTPTQVLCIGICHLSEHTEC
jgi:hypothetical protein